MKFILLTFLFIAILSVTFAAVEFRLVTDKAPWTPRCNVGLITMPVTIKTDSVTIPQGSLLLLGGKNSSNSQVTNDIWMSQNGKDWTKIVTTSTFAAYNDAAVAVDPNTGRIYRIAGEHTNQVWVSDNVVAWTKLEVFPSFISRSYPGAAVDSQGKVYVAGGFNAASQGLSDVWTSTNKGRSFTRVVGYNESSPYIGGGAAPWGGNKVGAVDGIGGRGVIDFASWKDPRTNQDLQFLWTGSTEPKTTYNDVWVSGNNGATWHVVCQQAPWVARNDDTGGITSNGVLVVVAGRPAVTPDDKELDPLNDVWASLDGGHTWGQCSAAAEFPDRRYHSSTFDANGYLYILGGLSASGTNFNDVWVSSFSFSDVDAVSSHCNLPKPACGPGLVCFPGSQRYGPDGVIRCAATDACNASSSSGNTSAVAALAVLFVISALVAAYALFYIYRSKKNLQSNYVSSSDSLGSLNDANSLYKPLTIHS